MQATLLLNASYEPLRIISWKKALTLLFAGKVEVIDEYDQQVHSITFAIKLPSIIRLLKYVRVKNHNRVKFSRANIYARDDYTCQYCGKKFPSEDLTFDHVVPVATGGQKTVGSVSVAAKPAISVAAFVDPPRSLPISTDEVDAQAPPCSRKQRREI